MDTEEVVTCLQKKFQERKQWVLFKKLSVVVIDNLAAGESLEEKATKIIKRDGPVMVGTPHGDFNVDSCEPGWLITSHSPDLFTYVDPKEILEADNKDLITIGLYGRSKRDEDSKNPEILHTERGN